MKLIDAINPKSGKIEIPDCLRGDLPEFFVQMGYKVGAEIGVYKAGFTEKFCKVGLKMFAIDPWKAYDGGGRNMKMKKRQDFLYGHAQRTLAPYRDCTIIRATSMDALSHFKDGSLDFVYIDGDHSFRYIAEDLVEWSKKVRSGGAVCGHDYFYYGPQSDLVCQVGPVVDAYIKVFEIKNLYIFGKAEDTHDKDDKYPSWMYIKP